MMIRTFVKSTLLVATALFTIAAGTAKAVTVTVINDCNQTIWPAIYLSNASAPNGGGWTMAPNTTSSFTMSNNANGRMWARKNCDINSSPYECATGSCGGSGAECNGSTGQEGTSLFEFTLVPNGTDSWDVSYVDGYDFPIGVTWSNNSKACTYSGGTSLSNPTCKSDVVSGCPSALQDVVSGTDVECESPCTANNNQNQQLCCAGPYAGGPAVCDEAGWPTVDQSYVNLIHQDCPGTYGYPYDDATSTWNCPNETNYTVTFCPNGVQTSGGSGPGGSGNISGAHALTPETATGSRLDDFNSSTTNDSKVALYQADGGPNQEWNFGLVSGSNGYNAATLGPYCLDDCANPDGAVCLWSCNGGPNQQWNATENSDGSYTFVNSGDKDCLDDFGGGTSNGNTIGTWTCNSQSNQKWYLD